ncbi:MAG TPA: PQQ-dependent sugar dehydrogenase, partial [Steroidobacteraceae bacterium]
MRPPTRITRERWSLRHDAVLVTLFMMTACSGGGGGSGGGEPPIAPTPSAGLDQRPDNMTCLAPDRPGTQGQLSLTVEQVFPALTFEQPVAMLQAPQDASRWFVVEQGGSVRVFQNDEEVTSFETFIDLTSRVESGGEKGLLGMAFHPQFPSDPRVYLSYTTLDGALISRISEFRSNDGGQTLDPTSERVLITIVQPQENHNGGGIAFGPDGYLYVGMGDGGASGDRGPGHGSIGNGQNLQT